MENWRKNGRKDAMIVEMDALVPKDHLLRKVEQVMDYEWLYERLEPYYCADNGRPGTDPVVLIKMVLLQHLYGIPSLRQTHQRIMDTISYRWFLGYNLLEEIPHFSTVSYAFCKRFPSELSEEIFAHILNKMINHRMVDPSKVYIDGTHIKASANKKKYQKEQIARAAKVYTEQLREEVNAERVKLGKKPIEEDEDDEDKGSGSGGGTVERTVSITDPDRGLFVKGEHERPFAYEAHTACDKNGVVLGVNVTANLQIGVKPQNEKNYTSHIAPKSRHDKQTCKGSRFADLGLRSAAALRRLTSSDHAVLRHGCCRQPYIKADRYATQPVCESIVFRYSFTFA